MPNNPFLPQSETWQWLAEALALLGWIGMAVATLVALGLLVWPPGVISLDQVSARWVDFNTGFARFDQQPITVERWVYRRHRWMGSFLIVGTAYSLWRWAVAYDGAAFLRDFAPDLQRRGLDWVPAGLEFAFVLFNGLILLLGVAMLLRPSVLKVPEAWSNRTISGSRFSRHLDNRSDSLTELAVRHPRKLGAVLLLGCLFAYSKLL